MRVCPWHESGLRTEVKSLRIEPIASLECRNSTMRRLAAILAAHAGPWRHIALWRGEASGGAKVSALVSLLLWPGAVCAGRLIAYF
jgi:hypothetical protein